MKILIYFKKKILLTPNFWLVVYMLCKLLNALFKSRYAGYPPGHILDLSDILL